jgi:hypothetical protein
MVSELKAEYRLIYFEQDYDSAIARALRNPVAEVALIDTENQ